MSMWVCGGILFFNKDSVVARSRSVLNEYNMSCDDVSRLNARSVTA